MRVASAIFAFSAMWMCASARAQLRPETVAAFDRYTAQAESRMRQEQSAPSSFIAVSFSGWPGRDQELTRLRGGEIFVRRAGDASAPMPVPGGLIHHWSGVAFIPGTTIEGVLAVVQDYDHLARYYSPEVISSKLITHDGDDYRMTMRVRKHKVLTVVLDTDYAVHRGRLDERHQFVMSRSTRVAEIADPGSGSERALDAGHDHGFLWRLNSYWRFEQMSDGVLAQCEAISLTRGIPTGLGWMVGPMVNDIPRESLEFTLKATRDAVVGRKIPETKLMTQVTH